MKIPTIATLLCGAATWAAAQAAPGDWPAYGRDAGGSRFSPLASITPANVASLQPAWVYRTGDFMWNRGRFEATPLLVGGTLYLATPLGRGVVRAYDARSGRQRGSFDPIPRTATAPGRETWSGTGAAAAGAANVWSVISVDAARDLVFLPVGSASPDFFGGERPGEDRWAD